VPVFEAGQVGSQRLARLESCGEISPSTRTIIQYNQRVTGGLDSLVLDRHTMDMRANAINLA
jgi:hypothetical protein